MHTLNSTHSKQFTQKTVTRKHQEHYTLRTVQWVNSVHSKQYTHWIAHGWTLHTVTAYTVKEHRLNNSHIEQCTGWALHILNNTHSAHWLFHILNSAHSAQNTRWRICRVKSTNSKQETHKYCTHYTVQMKYNKVYVIWGTLALATKNTNYFWGGVLNILSSSASNIR